MQDWTMHLNAPNTDDRLGALRALKAALNAGEIARPATGRDVNNHIHTTYSFSPYSPAKAVWMSYQAGLCTAGIVDHDSISGAREFIRAGGIMAFPVTVGFELRATHAATALGDRRTNNPDQNGISYLTFHGVPHTQIDDVAAFLQPVSVARGKRNRAMVQRIAACTGIPLDYDADVLPLSNASEGGSVTERHLLYALALKMIARYGKGAALLQALESLVEVSAKAREQLADTENPYYAHDLLGLLKAQLVEQFYLPANEQECPDIREAIRFADEHGIILAYPYLGDVGDSVTGDKKAQAFEDSYLDELFEILHGMGIRAISYMPSRNSREQLTRLRALCDRYGMLQISGEDINSPRQPFICMAQRDPAYANLFATTWALIGHELAATDNLSDGFPALDMPLDQKIAHFCAISKPWRDRIFGETK